MSSQLSDLVQATKDPLVLVYVMANLGKNVPHDACFTDSIMHIRRKVVQRMLGRPPRAAHHHPMQAQMFWLQQRQVAMLDIGRLQRKQREMIEDHLTTALLDVQERDLATRLFQHSTLDRFIHKLAEGGPDLLRDQLRNDDPIARLLVTLTIARRRIHLEKELIERLNDPHPAVRQAVHGTLVRLARGTDFGPARNTSQPGLARCSEKWRQWLTLQEDVSTTSLVKKESTPSIARPMPLDIDKVIALPPVLEKRLSPSGPTKD